MEAESPTFLGFEKANVNAKAQFIKCFMQELLGLCSQSNFTISTAEFARLISKSAALAFEAPLAFFFLIEDVAGVFDGAYDSSGIAEDVECGWLDEMTSTETLSVSQSRSGSNAVLDRLLSLGGASMESERSGTPYTVLEDQPVCRKALIRQKMIRTAAIQQFLSQLLYDADKEKETMLMDELLSPYAYTSFNEAENELHTKWNASHFDLGSQRAALTESPQYVIEDKKLSSIFFNGSRKPPTGGNIRLSVLNRFISAVLSLTENKEIFQYNVSEGSFFPRTRSATDAELKLLEEGITYSDNKDAAVFPSWLLPAMLKGTNPSFAGLKRQKMGNSTSVELYEVEEPKLSQNCVNLLVCKIFALGNSLPASRHNNLPGTLQLGSHSDSHTHSPNGRADREEHLPLKMQRSPSVSPGKQQNLPFNELNVDHQALASARRGEKTSKARYDDALYPPRLIKKSSVQTKNEEEKLLPHMKARRMTAADSFEGSTRKSSTGALNSRQVQWQHTHEKPVDQLSSCEIEQAMKTEMEPSTPQQHTRNKTVDSYETENSVKTEENQLKEEVRSIKILSFAPDVWASKATSNQCPKLDSLGRSAHTAERDDEQRIEREDGLPCKERNSKSAEHTISVHILKSAADGSKPDDGVCNAAYAKADYGGASMETMNNAMCVDILLESTSRKLTGLDSKRIRNESKAESQTTGGRSSSVEDKLPVGLLLCVNPKIASQQIVDLFCEACEVPVISLVKFHMEINEKVYGLLRLQLHQHVFTDAYDADWTVQRLLSLVHITLNAEQAAFYTLDFSNKEFICFGGHLNSRGLVLSFNHPILGSVFLSNGKISLRNSDSPHFSTEYDLRSDIITRNSLLIPLVNSRGTIKGVIHVMNRRKRSSLGGSSGKKNDYFLLRKNSFFSNLSYGEALRDYPTMSFLKPQLEESFYWYDAMLMKAIQSEIYHELSGELDALSMDIMSLLQPMKTMISSVMQPHLFELGQHRQKNLMHQIMAEISFRKQLGGRNDEKNAEKVDAGRVDNSNTHSTRRNSRGSSIAQDDDSSSKFDELDALCVSSESQGNLLRVSSTSVLQPTTREKSLSKMIQTVDSTHYAAEDDSDSLGDLNENASKIAYLVAKNPSYNIVDHLQNESGDGSRFDEFRFNLSLKSLNLSWSMPDVTQMMKMHKYIPDIATTRARMLLSVYADWKVIFWNEAALEIECFIMMAINSLGLLSALSIEPFAVRWLISSYRDLYHIDNPYHNYYHAAHVFQACWIFISQYNLRDILQPMEQLGLLLAALSHDVDHPGLSNQFLSARHSDLAVLYNDRSVLENHHCILALDMLKRSGVFAGEPKKYLEIRRVMINSILATDMEMLRTHQAAMRQRANLLQSERRVLSGAEDRALLVQVTLHLADICNPVIPGGVNKMWASLIIQEFNAQVDLERHHGLPVTTFMDIRTELERVKSQIGFLSFVVLDQFRAFAKLVPHAEALVQSGEANLREWHSICDSLTSSSMNEETGEPTLEEGKQSCFSFRLKHISFEGMKGPKRFGYTLKEVYDGYQPPTLLD